jgi:predicted phage terminase large subunit-like protein
VTDLKVELLPWQQEVFEDSSRFKVIAAGRRTGKSRLAAWKLIIEGLQCKRGHVFYVAPTQGQARDIMWQTLLEVGHPVIASSHINNLQIKLVNGATIALKGADRPETMRGVSLSFLCMDEYADMKPEVWEQILRPALADQKGDAMFIGTPMGRNHFTSYDNPLLDEEEINAAKKSMSAFSFRQEFMASFEAAGGELFKEEHIQFSEEEPDEGQFYIAVDLAGFADVQTATTKTNRLDQTSIAVVKAGTEGWWVADIIHGRWGVEKTARKIFDAVRDYQPVAVGIEKGALKNAVYPYLNDIMKANQRFFRVEELTHGNKRKIDRIVWALQGRFEHGKITLNKGEWNTTFLDELFQFPNKLVHDDLIDSLAYIDQLAQVAYAIDYEEEEYELTDYYSGY